MIRIILFLLGACTVLAKYDVMTTAKITLRDSKSSNPEHFEGTLIYKRTNEDNTISYLVEFKQTLKTPPAEQLLITGPEPTLAITYPGFGLPVEEPVEPETEPEKPVTEPEKPVTEPEIDQEAANQHLMEDAGEITGEETTLFLRLGRRTANYASKAERELTQRVENVMQGGDWVHILDGIPRGFAEKQRQKWLTDWSVGNVVFQKALNLEQSEYALITYWKNCDCWTVEYWYQRPSNKTWTFSILYQYGRGVRVRGAYGYGMQPALQAGPFTNALSKASDSPRLPTFGRWTGTTDAPAKWTRVYGNPHCSTWKTGFRGNYECVYVESVTQATRL